VTAILLESLTAALDRRADFFTSAAAQDTDCYRLLHGIAEGAPGLTVDRYGEVVLIQTWREELAAGDLSTIRETVAAHLDFDPVVVWNHRAKGQAESFETWHALSDLMQGRAPEFIGQEAGLRFCVTPRHRGSDPLLFLDLRAGRQHVRSVCQQRPGLRVLNLFAYTCGVGIAADAGGAAEVWNVDFAESALAIGKRNAVLNGLSEDTTRHVHGDAFVIARQLAGLSVKGRYGKLPAYESIESQQFDLVVLDPPKWAKSPFGVVDLVRDYQSVFKPALLATKPDGQLLVTNNVARVDADTWLDSLRRCAEKNGRSVRDLRLIPPDEDFPSFDGQPPLKMAAMQLGGSV
jgi:23S rRNA (cytosine1962-C5)-methyltransferase